MHADKENLHRETREPREEELSRQDAKNAKFGAFELGAFRFVSDFDIRISDFPAPGRVSVFSPITYPLSLPSPLRIPKNWRTRN
jgi:hypothetical protein